MQDVTVRYPFHPLTGQSFVALGRYEHYGALHVLVRGMAGATYLLPAWMTTAAAGAVEVVEIPRLSVDRLLALRELLDRIATTSPSGRNIPGGHNRDETIETGAAGTVPS